MILIYTKNCDLLLFLNPIISNDPRAGGSARDSLAYFTKIIKYATTPSFNC